MPTYADLLNQHRAAGLDNAAALRTTDDQWQAWPVQLAEARGHDVVLDGAERWTCTCCRRAVLRAGANVYGSAVEQDCGADIYAFLRDLQGGAR